MKTQATTIGLLAALLVGVAGCGSNTGGVAAPGSATAGEPQMRTVTGSVGSGSTSLSKSVRKDIESGCLADRVLATDSSGNTKSASVKEDCAFSIALEVQKTYALSLTSDGEFIAAMLFRNNDGLPTSQLTLEDGSVIYLGTIQIIGDHAFPENEPLAPDGTVEDGETVAEVEEEVEEAAEEEAEEKAEEKVEEKNEEQDQTDELPLEKTDLGDIGEEPLSDGEPSIVKISPSNGAKNIAVDKAITAESDCRIDEASVSKAIFNVGDREGDHVSCNVSLSKSKKEVVCEHDDFLPNMNYVLTVEGLHCAKAGRGSVRSLTWHFKTK